jgi:hypothetical protein
MGSNTSFCLLSELYNLSGIIWPQRYLILGN